MWACAHPTPLLPSTGATNPGCMALSHPRKAVLGGLQEHNAVFGFCPSLKFGSNMAQVQGEGKRLSPGQWTPSQGRQTPDAGVQEHPFCPTGPVRASPHTGPHRPPGPPSTPSPGTPTPPPRCRPAHPWSGLCLAAADKQPFFSPPPRSGVCIPAARLPPPRPHRPAALPRNARNEAQQGCRPPHQPPTASAPQVTAPSPPSSHIPQTTTLTPRFCQAAKSVSQ